MCGSLVAQPRIMALVREHLAEDLQPEMDRWVGDLDREGYTGLVESWPDTLCENRNDNAHLNAVWDFIRSKYNESARLQGVVLVGRFPYEYHYTISTYENGELVDKEMVTNSSFCLEHMGSFERAPTSVNIWVSRVDALDRSAAPLAWGSEVDLIKRYFQTNHEQRMGVCRLPHKAYGALGFDYDEPERITQWREDLLAFYPAYQYVERNERPAFDGGGQYFAEFSHGNGADRNVVYTFDDVLLAPAQIRHNCLMSCGANTIGGMLTKMLFTCHSLITSGQANYRHTDETYMDLLRDGKSYGEAHIACPDLSLWDHLVGDWSLKPMMNPDNATPRIRRVTIVDTPVVTGVPVRFAVNAYDNDGALETIEFYPEGYGILRDGPFLGGGEYEPVVYAYSDTFEYTFEEAGTFTSRVLVGDDYKAWAWRNVTVTVNDGGSYARNDARLDRPTTELNLTIGGRVVAIPVASFPVSLRVVDLQGRNVEAHTVGSPHQRVVLRKKSGVCMLEIESAGVEMSRRTVRF